MPGVRLRGGWLVLVLAGCLAGCGGPASPTPFPLGSGPTPILVTPSSSPLQGGPAVANPRMAYDEAEQLTVLFGTGPAGEPVTWTWDGSSWTQQHPASSPPAATGATLAYDAGRRDVLLFGGSVQGARTNGTWTWRAGTWTQLHPAVSPPPRENAGAAYEANHGSVVLFGGCCTGEQFAPTPLGDTWSWDGTTWKPEHPASGPAARQGASMVEDQALRRVVLFGGLLQGSDSESTDLWTWDGASWASLHPPESPPPEASYAATALDVTNNRLVMLAGYAGGPQTWTWDGKTWKRQSPANTPEARARWLMAEDLARQRVVLLDLSGTSAPDVTWTWDGTTWTREP